MKNNNKEKAVLYTGDGANNSGRHTKKQFMKIAKRFSKDCRIKKAEKKCNPCKKLKEFEFEIMDAEFEAMDQGKKYKISKSKRTRRSTLKKKCKKCTKKNVKKCNFEELMEYSGAELNN